jgi:hypothetical protein
MIFANEASDRLQKADHYLEPIIGGIMVLSALAFALDRTLSHRRDKTKWTRQEIQIVGGLIFIGTAFLVFSFFD